MRRKTVFFTVNNKANHLQCYKLYFFIANISLHSYWVWRSAMLHIIAFKNVYLRRQTVFFTVQNKGFYLQCYKRYFLLPNMSFRSSYISKSAQIHIKVCKNVYLRRQTVFFTVPNKANHLLCYKRYFFIANISLCSWLVWKSPVLHIIACKNVYLSP